MDERNKVFELSGEEKKILLQLSRNTLINFVCNDNKTIDFNKELHLNLCTKGVGAFVTLYKNNKLRGCIGKFQASNELYQVIKDLTISACSQDYRFSSVETNEINHILIELSILSPLKQIKTIDELELGKHGLLIRKGVNSGTYLPKVANDMHWSKIEFVEHCSHDKAGLGYNGWKTADLFIYTVDIISELSD